MADIDMNTPLPPILVGECAPISFEPEGPVVFGTIMPSDYNTYTSVRLDAVNRGTVPPEAVTGAGARQTLVWPIHTLY